MKWRQGRRSSNIEDRRGGRMPRGIKTGGISCLGLLVIIILSAIFGIDPSQLLDEVAQEPPVAVESQPPSGTAGDELTDFVSVVLADTEDTWSQLLAGHGRRYQEPVLVLFSDRVSSACGFASAASGPFYCPADHKVYLDLVFFEELRTRFRAPGDCAQAYVIAHEVGHHVQNLLGISAEVHSRQRRSSKTETNQLSVRLELQADCFAGVWAHHAQRVRNILEQGDLEEALSAASAVGDDRIQHQSRGYVVPDSFTHGTSRQRMQWFTRGFESGDFLRCDTFNATLD